MDLQEISAWIIQYPVLAWSLRALGAALYLTPCILMWNALMNELREWENDINERESALENIDG